MKKTSLVMSSQKSEGLPRGTKLTFSFSVPARIPILILETRHFLVLFLPKRNFPPKRLQLAEVQKRRTAHSLEAARGLWRGRCSREGLHLLAVFPSHISYFAHSCLQMVNENPFKERTDLLWPTVSKVSIHNGE